MLHFGLTPTAFQTLYPKKWKKQKDKMEFTPIFAKDAFSPEAGAMLLWDWWSQVSRYVVPQYTIFKYQAKLELNICFENYEAIQHEQREEFEYLIFRFLYAQKLTINGIEKHSSRRDLLPSSLYIWMTYIIGMVFIVFSAIPISVGITLLSDVNIPSLLGLILYPLVILGSIAIAVYLGYLIGFLIWLLILKPFFGRKVMLMNLRYRSSQPRKYKIGNPEGWLINWIIPEKDTA
ncbi:MAG: hypothetical protein QM730_30805 [Anaerolineales bacterium]